MSNEAVLGQKVIGFTRTLRDAWSNVIVKEEECEKGLSAVTVPETTSDETVIKIKKEALRTIQFLLCNKNEVKQEPLFINSRDNQSPTCDLEAPVTTLNKFDFEKPRTYRCYFCGKKFTQKILRNIHLEQNHKLKRIKKPEKTLPDALNLRLNCFTCSQVFENREKLRKHKKELHSKNSNITPSPFDPNRYCRSCNMTFAYYYRFLEHLRKTHEIIAYLKKFDGTPDPDDKPEINITDWYCRPCGFQALNKESYFNHLKRLHFMSALDIDRAIHAEVKPDFDNPDFRCAGCKYKYTTKYRYHKHLYKIYCCNDSKSNV
ncbi:uncharacterized protein EV154DRAFT_489394 [Mucor mucedo]|uniref:uncharacterized protein n=1 Tax=Mucor mucedo TaxID=29922 RepID=UPI00221E3AE1|nr:uncharacterized protein EV154DRAFT_489394 [Mucor mucedo]KAI7897231.1 hypothetical protein EV154DRAFT_489394 [Mucor mucedo]